LYAQTQLGADLDGEGGEDQFGFAVAISSDGTRVAISGKQNDGNGANAGHVRIYEESGGAWTQIGSDIDGEAAGDESGRSIDLSSDGKRIVIGAWLNDGNGDRAGHVRIYEESGGTWSQVGSDIDGKTGVDESGYSVAISSDGTRVAITTRTNNNIGSNGWNSGYVGIYEEVGGVWTQVGNDIEGENANDASGFSISLSSDGTRVAISSTSNDDAGNNAGHVRIYEESGGTWSQVGSDIDGEAANDQSGYSVSLSSSGTRVAIGARFNDGNGDKSGHVRIYEESGGAWSQVYNDIDGEAAGDYLGYAVSFSSDGIILAIGGPYNDGNGNGSGHVRIYYDNGSEWIQLGSDIDGEVGGDLSGHDVAISGDGARVVIGAIYNGGVSGTGHARVYDLPSISSWSMGSSGDWNASGNWSGGQAPDANTAATIDGNVSVTISGMAEALSLALTNGADLVINGNLTVPTLNDIEIPASSKISGSGTINGDVVNNGGNICMGNSPGVLSVVGAVDMTSGTTDVEINGIIVGTQYDQLSVSGTVTIGANANLNITFGGGFFPAVNDVFDIITANTITGTFDLANISFSGGNVTDLSIAYINGTTARVTINAILPVELSYFEALLKNQKAELRWQTLSETQNKGFAIQRSKDLKSWEEIAYVEGAGTTHQISNYHWVDDRPMKGQSYYRLQQQDYDGGIAYSPIQSILLNTDDFRVFPNPFTNEINLINGQGELSIFNAFGKLVTQLQVNEEQQIIDLSYLPKGSYLITIKRPNGVDLSRLIMK
jgi:hypothetical protein